MTPLVSPEWLSTRLQDPNTVILDATLPPVGVTPPIDTRARYLDRHIPGALFFNIEELSDHSTPLPHMLPTAEDFSRSMSALGIADTSTIVVYEQAGGFSAPPAWWTLLPSGAQPVDILDGGLRAWIDNDLQSGAGPVHRAPSIFH